MKTALAWGVFAGLFVLAFLPATAQFTDHQRADILEEKVRNVADRNQLLEALRLPTTEMEGTRNVEVDGGAEPFIAIDPNDPSHLAISFMEPDLDFPIYWSNNGGFTWNLSSFDCLAAAQEITGGQILGGGDPVLEFDKDGRLHLTWIYLLGSFIDTNFTVYYAYSDDFGASFQQDESSQVVHTGDLVSFDLIDRQWMASDHTDGPYSGNVYMSGAYFGESITAAGEIVMTLTPDGDQFENAVTVYSGNGFQYGNVKVDGQGYVHLSCFGFDDQNGTSGSVVHGISTDGGQTFTTQFIAEGVGHPNLSDASHLVHGRENAAVSMAVTGNHVLIAWTDFSDDFAQAYYAYSTDNGTTWSDPIAFAADLFEETDMHFMPALGAHWNRVTVGWYVVDSETLETEYYVMDSQDSGITWDAPQAVSSGTTDFSTDTDFDFYGDYNTATKYGCSSYHLWSDGSTGSPTVYAVKMDGCTGTVHVSDLTAVNAAWQVGALYPNPVQNEVNLPLSGNLPQYLDYVVVDLQGKRLLHGALDPAQPTVDVSGLSAGQYFLRISGSDSIYAVRTFMK